MKPPLPHYKCATEWQQRQFDLAWWSAVARGEPYEDRVPTLTEPKRTITEEMEYRDWTEATIEKRRLQRNRHPLPRAWR